MATGQAIAKKAFEQLAASVSASDKRQFKDTALADVWQAAREIEKEQAARRDLRFMRRLEPFLKTIDSYSDVLGVMCQGYPPMSFVWGPIKLMLVLAKNYGNVIDKILGAFGDIAENLPRIDRLKATFPNSEDLNRRLALLYSDLLEFHGRAYKMFRRRAWHSYFAIDWGFFERRFKSILQRLSMQCELLDKEAAATHFFEMNKFREERLAEDEAFEQRRQNQMAKDVMAWLSESEDMQEEYLHRISDSLQLGTCTWIIGDPHIRPWMEEQCSNKILWMTGIPGAGKSFVMSFLAQHLLGIHGQRTCAYFFCGANGSAGLTCVTILRTIALQIIGQNLDMAPLVHEAFVQKTAKPSSLIIKKMLAQIIPDCKAPYILVDGVDELDLPLQQEELLKHLLDITHNAEHKCKLFVSSREEPQIKKYLSSSQVKLEAKTASGLRQYIESSVEKLKAEHDGIGGVMENNIKARLHAKADGMFLWVRLVVAMLSEKGSIAEIEDAIGDLPSGLNEAYDRILVRINKHFSPYRRERALTILCWLCAARRPVSVHEVVDGIALHFNATRLDRRTRISNFDRDVLELCAPLLETAADETLDLVHSSAKEYLLHIYSGPFVPEAQSHFDIARSCIRNLVSALDLVPGLSTLNESEIETRVVKGHYGLYSYGHEFWTEHLLLFMAATCESGSGPTEELLQELHGLSPMYRYPSNKFEILDSRLNRGRILKGLQELEKRPQFVSLLAGFLWRRLKMEQISTKYSTAEEQETELMQSDDTFVTLISQRLHTVTERILRMDQSLLPEHIETIDFQHFVRRYRFQCRYFECSQGFRTEHGRDTHERNHSVSFPCLDCDFSSRGFASRRDLEKHIRTYHLSPDDYKIPSSLRSETITSRHHGAFGGQTARSQSWNDQGRKAIQRGFREILKSVDSTLESGRSKQENAGHTQHKDDEPDLQLMSDKVERQQYETLGHFKTELRDVLSGLRVKRNYSDEAIIESACVNGLNEAATGFPCFAGVDDSSSDMNDLRHLHGKEPTQYSGHVTDVVEHEVVSFQRLSADRAVYWSLAEERGFPDLLRRYGSHFAMIAHALGTKSAEDVSRYFNRLVSEGRMELQEIADQTDAVSAHESFTASSGLALEVADSNWSLALRTGNALPNPLAAYGQPFAPSLQSSWEPVGPQDPESVTKEDTNKPLSLTVSENSLQPRTKRRRPRPRALCPYCNDYPEGLHDEYARQKHINRFHSRIRKVWFCSDISIDKQFLLGCKACSVAKRYGSRHKAGKHLRAAHFTPETSAQTLGKWMRDLDEPNPNFRGPRGESPSDEDRSKRQKIGDVDFKLAPVIDPPTDDPRLPPMMAHRTFHDSGSTTPPSGARSLDEGKERAENELNVEVQEQESDASDDDIVLQDVSFDKILAGGRVESSQIDDDGPPHRSNKALIKPEQVPKLPHLDRARKAACSDQVEALHWRLEQANLGSRKYKVQLEKLEALSRALMRNFEDWRRTLACAPELPFTC